MNRRINATNILIPQHELEDFIRACAPRYSEARINNLATRLQIHPGIIVGQLQHRREISYAAHRKLLTKVTVFGDTAIATGGFKGKGTDAMGKPFDNNERWTDTWMKMPSGKWQCVASQATPIKM